MTAFAEMVAATNYSFLRGASHPADMVKTAVMAGLKGIGIADRNTVAGVVRSWDALRQMREELPDLDFRLATGARLIFADGTPDIVAYPATRHGWGQLTKLLTVGNLRALKGDCILRLGDLLAYPDDLLLIVMPTETFLKEGDEGARPKKSKKEDEAVSPAKDRPSSPLRLVETHSSAPLEKGLDGLTKALTILNTAAPGRVWLGASATYRGSDRRRIAKLAARAAHPRLSFSPSSTA